jgi:hypothetical protein
VKAVALFAAATAVIVGAGGRVFTLIYPTVDGRRAVLASAAAALLVQLVAFLVLRLGRRSNAIAAFGVGTVLRFIALAVYALVVVKAFGLASAPALLSLATFLFLSTLVEPLLLNV